MKLVDSIISHLEKWSDSGKIRGTYFEIFENPSVKDLLSIGASDIRFMADLDKKKLYVWDADSLLHADYLEKHTKKRTIGIIDGSYVFGNASFAKRVLKMLSLSSLHTHIDSDLPWSKWSWLANYMTDCERYFG